MDRFEVSAIFPASPEQLYAAWLDAAQHAAMTGAGAEGSADIGGEFRAWDGYIVARTLELEPHARIVQAWRTGDFDDAHPDSRLEVRFAAVDGGTRVTVRHSEIPVGDGPRYKEGWQDFYFTPMLGHFRG
jgi:activator of HSP90 ATPase